MHKSCKGLYLQGVDLRPRNKEPWYNPGNIIAKPIEALFGLNITKEELGSAELSEADLSHATLEGAFLSGAQFENAILRETNLKRAKLQWANFKAADLRKARLPHAYLVETDFTKATLTGADFTGANLYKANLEGVNLENVNLAGAHITKAKLDGADLRNAKLKGANFSNTDLSKTLLNPDQLTPDITLCEARVASNVLRDKTHAVDNGDGTWTSYRGCPNSPSYPHSKAAQYEREKEEQKREFKRIHAAYQRMHAGGDPTEWNEHQQKLNAEWEAARAQREAEKKAEKERIDNNPQVQNYWKRRNKD